MPLYWTIDSEARLFTGVAEGNVTLDDAIDLLEAMAGAKAMSYRKLFDGRDAAPEHDLRRDAVALRQDPRLP